MDTRFSAKTFKGLLVACSLLAGLAVLTSPQLAQAAELPIVIYVNAAAGGANNGTSWANAYTDLQPALTAAGSGTQIWVAAGTYRPAPSGSDRRITFAMKDGVAIYGGFPATGTPGWGDRNWETNVTTLSGDIDGNGILDDYNVCNVVRADGQYPSDPVTRSAVLDGFTITGGNANVSGGDLTFMHGGGLMSDNNASPTLNNLIITGNNANDGGGMFIDHGSPALYNVTFTSNTSLGGSGGGMEIGPNGLVIPAPLLTKVTFTGNRADTRGGGLYNMGAPVLTDVSFITNTAMVPVPTPDDIGGRGGGGMYNYQGNPALNRVTFTGNTGYNGGGVFFRGGSPVLNNVTFENNTAVGAGEGGGVYIESSVVNFTNVTFSGNQASSGGGLSIHSNLSSPSATLTDAKFLNNVATGYGGGIFMQGTSLTLTNCLFAGNSLSGMGGGSQPSAAVPP